MPFEVFEKLTSACFIQISRETILLRVNNIHKNVRHNCVLTYVYSEQSTDKFPCFVIKQLLDEAEHDIKNYSDRSQCYLPKRS